MGGGLDRDPCSCFPRAPPQTDTSWLPSRKVHSSVVLLSDLSSLYILVRLIFPSPTSRPLTKVARGCQTENGQRDSWAILCTRCMCASLCHMFLMRLRRPIRICM